MKIKPLNIIKASLKMLGYYGAFHFILLVIIAVTTADPSPLNLAHIVSLDYFFPGIEDVVWLNTVAWAITIGLIGFWSYKRTRLEAAHN